MAARERKYWVSMGGNVGLMAGLVLGGSSCSWDPIREDAIQSMGPEKAGVPPGPMHRPGQPCLVCHAELEQGNAPPFSLAGTIYMDMTSLKPVGDVAVTIEDAKGNSYVATTNCAGNFFVKPSEFTPVYPFWVTGVDLGMTHRSMDTPSFREGSCAGCHYEPQGASSVGPVVLIDDPTTQTPPANPCP